MRIALIFRGISYIDQYEHKYGIPKHTIDFRNTGDSIVANLIQPLREAGHTVDVMFCTYHSNKEKDLLSFYQPVAHRFKEYQAIPLGAAQTIIGEPMLIDQHMECIELMEGYEQEHGFQYDNVLITRFDLYYYQKITEVGVNTNQFNYAFWHIARPTGAPPIWSSEDNFLFYPRAKTELLKQSFQEMKRDIQSTHLSGKYLIQKGERVRYLFGEKGDGAHDYPFYKFARHIFGSARDFHRIEDCLAVPMNRIYHSEEEAHTKKPMDVYLGAGGAFFY